MMVKCCLLIVTIITSLASGDIIELNFDISPQTPIWDFEGAVPFTSSTIEKGTSRGMWVAMNAFCGMEHLSTHVDAPFHFYEQGWAVDEIPMENLIAPGVVIDVTKSVRTNNIYKVKSKDILDWVEENGEFENGTIVLIRTGWSTRYPDKRSYFGDDSDAGLYRFPGLGPDAVQTLLDYRKSGIYIVGIGIDTPAVDPQPNKGFPAHVKASAANVYNIENMKSLDKLPLRGFELTVMPMKIKGGSGAPARVIARTNGCTQVSVNFALLLVSFILCMVKLR